MNVSRGLFKILSSLLILGSFACLILTLITGAKTTSGISKFYWLETDCSKYPGSPIQGTCRWTSYSLCGVDSKGKNVDCTSSRAGYPFSPKDNFNSNKSIPAPFMNSRNKYYYMSRIGWAFSVIGLYFLLCSFVMIIVWLILGKLGWLFWWIYFVSFIFVAVSAALSTAVFSSGKGVFNHNGNSAKLGSRVLVTTWVTVGAYIVNFFVLTYLWVTNKKYNGNRYAEYEKEPDISEEERGSGALSSQYMDDTLNEQQHQHQTPPKKGFWKSNPFKKKNKQQEEIPSFANDFS